MTTTTPANHDKQPDREFARKLLQKPTTGKEQGRAYTLDCGKGQTRKQTTRRSTW